MRPGRAVRAVALFAAAAALAPLDAAAPQVRAGASAPVFGYRVLKTYPHDRQAYTQGLEFVNGVMFEGTGLNGRSSIRQVALDTGRVIRQRAVAAAHFGEGITVWKNRVIELTWRSEVAFVYDRVSFEPRGSFQYAGEGWGLTHDATSLIMSDGTADLRFLDPDTFKERRRITVTDGGRPVAQLNELEYVKGQVFANVWTTDRIARIDPQSGAVLSWIDLAGLLPAAERTNGDAVLNGIAYDSGRDRLFVTGKLWPTLFAITIVRRGA